MDQHLSALRNIKLKHFHTPANAGNIEDGLYLQLLYHGFIKEVIPQWKNIKAIVVQYVQLCIHDIRICYSVRMMMKITCAHTAYMNYLEWSSYEDNQITSILDECLGDNVLYALSIESNELNERHAYMKHIQSV